MGISLRTCLKYTLNERANMNVFFSLAIEYCEKGKAEKGWEEIRSHQSDWLHTELESITGNCNINE